MRAPGADSTVSISGFSRSSPNSKTSTNLKNENKLAGQLTAWPVPHLAPHGKSTTDNQVLLTGPAPQGGAVITLTSSDPSVRRAPANDPMTFKGLSGGARGSRT